MGPIGRFNTLHWQQLNHNGGPSVHYIILAPLALKFTLHVNTLDRHQFNHNTIHILLIETPLSTIKLVHYTAFVVDFQKSP